MPYSRLLKKVVAESGYSNKEIIELCREKGRNIDKSYFSRLLNSKTPPPSEELSETIAEICNVDKRLLVLEGFLDKAPKEIRDVFLNMQFTGSVSVTKMLENKLPQEVLDAFRKQIEKEPLAEFVIKLTNGLGKFASLDLTETEVLKLSDNEMKFTLNNPVSMPVYDNAMYPIVPENSKIILRLKEKYNDGDLIVIKAKDRDDMIVRYAVFREDKIILTSINKQYPVIEYELEDISIMGEVSQVIIDL